MTLGILDTTMTVDLLIEAIGDIVMRETISIETMIEMIREIDNRKTKEEGLDQEEGVDSSTLIKTQEIEETQNVTLILLPRIIGRHLKVKNIFMRVELILYLC